MANKKKKYVWLGVAGAALATLLVYFSIFWPPVPRGWVQGAIGKRDVYRQDKLTDKDIGVAGTVKVTVDDIRNFLQSPEFKSLAGNAQFNQLVADPRFQKIVQDAASKNIQLAVRCAPACANALPVQNLAQNPEVQRLLNSAQFEHLKNDPQLSKIFTMASFGVMMTNSRFQNLAAQSQLSSLLGHAALERIMTVKPFRN